MQICNIICMYSLVAIHNLKGKGNLVMISKHFFRSNALTWGGAIAAVCIAGASSGQTVTVDAANASPNGTTTFNTLHDAVASFATGTGSNAGNIAANVINIAPGTPVIDKVNADIEHPTAAMTIAGDMTIQGAGGLATLAGQPLQNGEQVLRETNSVNSPPVRPSFAWRQAGVLTLKNIAFVPTDATMRGLLLIKSPTSSDDLTVNLENCVLTSNNGSNLPIVTTGREPAPDLNASGVVTLGDKGDAIWALSRFERGDLTLNLKNTVIASFSSVSAGHNADGIIAYMNGTTSDLINCTVNINEGCVFANIDGRAIQNPYGGIVNVNGTASNPVVFREILGAQTIYNGSDTTGATQPTAVNVNYARFFNITGNAISEVLARAFVNSVTNTVIANGLDDGIRLAASGALPPNGEASGTITMDNLVIHNAGSGATPGGIYLALASNRILNITNSVFTGNDKHGIVNNGTGTVNVSNTILSTAGANALRTPPTVGTGVINLDPTVTNQAVEYVNMTDPFSPDFFKVVGSAVSDWSVY